MKYILKEDTPFGKKGLIYTHQSDSDTASAREDDVVWTMTSTEVFIFKKLGVLEEVGEDGKWVPKNNEEYWSVGSDGIVTSFVWCNDSFDKWHLAIGQVFSARKEAEAYRAEKLKDL